MGRPRIHKFNEQFFEVIDTEAKAYWLGMLTADGWIEADNYCTGLSLKDSDKEHVEKFMLDVGHGGVPVKKIKRENGREFISWTAQLYSKTMYESLLKYGIIPSKSLVAIPADHLIPNELRRHYWRGLTDGDGTITKHGKTGWTVSLCGTEPICTGLLRFASGNTVHGGFVHHDQPNLWTVRFVGSACPFDTAQLLYGGATVALNRKRILAETISEGERNSRWRSWPTKLELDAAFDRLGSWPAVAAELGTSSGGLWRIRKQLGYPVHQYNPERGRRGRPGVPHTWEEISSAYDELHSWPLVAKKLRTSPGRLWTLRKQLAPRKLEIQIT